MNIEDGKFYMNKLGDIKGPMINVSTVNAIEWIDQQSNHYDASGKSLYSPSGFGDLVEEVDMEDVDRARAYHNTYMEKHGW